MNKRQMQKLYWTFLGYVSIASGFPNMEDRINEELKTARQIETTSIMTAEEYYLYLEKAFDLVGFCFDLRIDVEAYKGGQVKFIYEGQSFY